jgi:hypothetical protein
MTAHLRNVLKDYGSVRIVTGGDPREVAYNIMVQIYIASTHKWRDVRGFNSFSNDYAYTSAQEHAEEFVKDVQS